MSENSLDDLMPHTPNVGNERLAELRRLFPDLFDGEGHLKLDDLKQLTGELPPQRERYDFTWRGKQNAKAEAYRPTTATLTYDAARSVNPEKANGNLIIEGENLATLKCLLPAYKGQVKCIYIDPPYNTGKDFVYSDNYSEGRQPYWEQTGGTEQGVRIDTNPDTAGRYHSNWLNMIYPRLLLARLMLRQDGYIVVSIDDAEAANLIRVLDEVFGEENRVASLVWDKNRKNDAKFFSVGHEYMLVYAKEVAYLRDNGVELRAEKEGVEEVREVFERLRKELNDNWEEIRKELKKYYSQWADDDPRKPMARFVKVDENGPYRDDRDISWPGGDGPDYEILHPVTKNRVKKPSRGWVYPSEERFWEAYNDEKIVFGEDETTIPSIRTNLFDSTTQVMRSVNFSYAQTAAKEFAKIFDGVKIFDNPKHFDDLKKIIEYLSDEDDIVLDFFAGSGSTGHGAMLCDKKRTYILVQIPEQIAESEVPYKAGYRKISDITIDRMRRVIAGYGDTPKPVDTGFKVFRLTQSHFPRLEFAPNAEKSEAENIEAFRAYIQQREAQLIGLFHEDSRDLIDEVLLKNGFRLDYTMEPHETFTTNTVYRVTDGYKKTLLCLDNTLQAETAAALIAEPQPFICLEGALDTSTKWNLKQHLKELFVAF